MGMWKSTRHVLGWFLPVWRRHRRGMLTIVAVTVVSIALSTAYPVIFKYVIDSLVDGRAIPEVQRYVWIILLVGLARTLTRWVLPSTRYVMNLIQGMDIKLSHFESLLNKDPSFFARYRSGDLITRFSDDVDGDLKLSWFAASGVMRPIEAGFTLLFSIGVMLTLHWQLTLLAIAPLPLIIWIMSRTEHLQHKAYTRRQETISQTNNYLESAFSGIRIVIGYVMEKAQTELFRRQMSERKTAEERVVLIRSVLESIGSLVNQIGLVIILFVGGYYVIRGAISLGDFYAFIAYMTGITEPIWTLSWFFVSLKMAESSVERLEEIRQAANRPPREKKLPAARDIRLEIRQVTYSFPSQADPVIREIDLQARYGEKIGIVGEVGAGKTVLLQLLAGWYSPDEGQILLNGTDLDQVQDSARAAMVGYVPQEVELFSGSVTENIVMGRSSSLDLDQVMHDAVIGNEFPADRVLEHGGIGLSGGQRARVALARALFVNPGILLFDDITSALDLNTERILWRRLAQAFPAALLLVATHREATAAGMDRILWLQKGRVFQDGTHTQLLREFPEYRALFARD